MATEKRLIWDEDAQHRLVALAVKRGSDAIPLDMITYILFNESPTVDAVEVVHGRWIQDAPFCCVCSVCNCARYGLAHESHQNYCPNCGAKMDGGKL